MRFTDSSRPVRSVLDRTKSESEALALFSTLSANYSSAPQRHAAASTGTICLMIGYNTGIVIVSSASPEIVTH